MATFSQGFLSSLGRPQMAESLFGLGQAVGGVPGQMRQRRQQEQFNQLMQQAQGAQGAGDFVSMKLLSQQLADAGYTKEAGQLMQSAVELEKKNKQQQAVSGLFEGTPTEETVMAGAKQLLATGDVEGAMRLREKAVSLGTTERARQAGTAAIQQELQGYMMDPKASPEVKRMANQIYRGFVVGRMQPEAVEQQMKNLRTLAQPRTRGSMAAPQIVEVQRKDPKTGEVQNIKVERRFNPVTGEREEELLGFVIPEEADEVKESTTLLKIENTLTQEVREISSKARRAEELATGLEKYDPVGGVAGSLTEYIKEISGEQDAISALRTEASRLTTSEAVANLPKGPASDRDIALVLKGVPPANAKADYLAQYARGVAKMQQAEADYKREQLNWLSKNRSYKGFNAYMTKKKVEEQFAIVPPEALQEMEANLNDPVYRNSFIKRFKFDYVQYKQELEDAKNILEGI